MDGFFGKNNDSLNLKVILYMLDTNSILKEF